MLASKEHTKAKRFSKRVSLHLLCMISFALFCIRPSSAQNYRWAKASAGSGNDEGYAVSSDASGNVFITGAFKSKAISFGSITLQNTDTSGSTPDIFIAKYDSSGNVLWAKSAGGNAQDESYAVSTDANGNAFITGYSFSNNITFGSVTLTNSGTYNFFIAKYDPSGNVLWAKRAAGNNTSEGYAVSTDAAGDAVVTGSFQSSSISFGSNTLSNAGASNVFLVKYNTSGNVLWAKKMGGSTLDIGRSVTVSNTGEILVAGSFSSTSFSAGSNTLSNADASGNTYDAFIAKYDAGGNAIWARQAGGSNDDEAYSVSVDDCGFVFVAGYYQSSSIAFGANTLNNAGASDAFIAKYDPNGNVLWARSAGGTGYDEAFSVCTDKGDNAYIAGGFDTTGISFGSTTLPLPANAYDPMFIAKYASNGNLLYAQTLASGGDDQNSICTDKSGNAYVAADFEKVNPFILGQDSLMLTGTEDVFLAKISGSYSLPSPDSISPDTSICVGQSVTLTANGDGTYLWDNGSTTSSISVTPGSSSNYSVIISKGTCKDTLHTSVAIDPGPQVTISGNTSITAGNSTTLIASGGSNYQWSNGTASDTNTVRPAATTTYCVEATDSTGCTDSTCVTVTVNDAPCGDIFVPTAFSPNNDGNNDFECVLGGCIKSFYFAIYDRWGNKVFESTDQSHCWDGTYKGQPMNSGVFVYYLRAETSTGNTIEKKGNVALVR